MTLRLSIENVDRLPDGGPVRIEVKGEGSILAATRISIGPCLTQAEAFPASIARSAFGTADTGCTTSRPTGPSSTARNTGSTRPISCATATGWASGPTSSPLRSKKDEGAQSARSGGGGLVRRWPRGRLGRGRRGRRARNRRPAPAAQTRDAPPDFLDFASFLEAPKAGPAPMANPPRSEDDWLTAIAPLRRPPGARRSGASQTGADAAGGRRPAASRPGASRPEPRRRRSTPPRGASFSIASPGRRAFPSAFSLRAIRPKSPTRSARVIRLTPENLAQMLASRAEAKTLMRSSSRTMIRAVENNPLKFASSPAEALAIMFGPPTRNYLDARATIERSFRRSQEPPDPHLRRDAGGARRFVRGSGARSDRQVGRA